jgi:protein ImuA
MSSLAVCNTTPRAPQLLATLPANQNQAQQQQARKPAKLAALRAQIQRLEGHRTAAGAAVLPLGLAPIDAALHEGGLSRAAVHEITGADTGDGTGDGAATGFCATIVGRLLAADAQARPVLWLSPGRDLYAPGLTVYGLTPGRLLTAGGLKRDDLIWALETALRSGTLAGVVAEVVGLNLTSGRRLQLAAEAGRTPALLLAPTPPAGPTAAVTRWVVSALRGAEGPQRTGAELAPPVGRVRWHARLVKCRGGRPGDWTVSWCADGWQVEVPDTTTLPLWSGLAQPEAVAC